MNFNFGVVAEYHQLFLKGTLLAIGMTLVCVAIGIVLGILLGMGRLAESKYAPWNHILKFGVQWPVRIYVSFFRGTPLFVKILLFHFALMPLFIHPTNGWFVSGDLARDLRGEYGAFISGTAAIAMNLGAYLSEVFRAGIQSLDKGQTEASRSLGMSYWQSIRLLPECCPLLAITQFQLSKILHLFQPLALQSWPMQPEALQRPQANIGNPTSRQPSCTGSL